ncbi:MAG: hypothetical protein AB3N21_12285 [Ruegeria sp.]|uniref:hypothetical protein n=1 Tax=Ruegeria sp. TaxID=1879320 RepID=UPI00349E52AD
MRRTLLAIILALMATGPACAGAWLREKGTGFVAATTTVHRLEKYAYEYKSSLYLEWGAFERVTLGLDVNEHQGLSGHALLFARLPIHDFGKAGRFAAELGAGAYHWQTTWAPMYKATLSYGKGLNTGWGNGWIAVDTALEYRTDQPLIRKLDLTTGLSSGRLLDPLLQVETTYIPGKPFYWSVTPSLIYRPKLLKSTWVLGIEQNALKSQPGLKVALWRDF